MFHAEQKISCTIVHSARNCKSFWEETMPYFCRKILVVINFCTCVKVICVQVDEAGILSYIMLKCLPEELIMGNQTIGGRLAISVTCWMRSTIFCPTMSNLANCSILGLQRLYSRGERISWKRPQA